MDQEPKKRRGFGFQAPYVAFVIVGLMGLGWYVNVRQERALGFVMIAVAIVGLGLLLRRDCK